MGISFNSVSNGLWHLKAACRGPNQRIFFPPARSERRKDKKRREQKAKAICQTCSVVTECRSYALQIGEQHGIWGGLTGAELREINQLVEKSQQVA